MKKRLKINGVIIFFTLSSIVLFPSVFFPCGRITYPEAAARAFGIAFVLAGQILRVSGRGYKSENSGEGSFLIQGGPYSLARNPMYLGILLIGLGIVLMLFKWWAALAFLAIFSWRYLPLMFSEEKKLISAFPQEYKDYGKKVPRLFPWPLRLSKKNIAGYLPLKLPWLKKEAGTIVSVLLAAFFLQAWIDIKRGGIKALVLVTALNLIAAISFTLLVIYLIGKTGKDASSAGKNTF